MPELPSFSANTTYVRLETKGFAWPPPFMTAQRQVKLILQESGQYFGTKNIWRVNQMLVSSSCLYLDNEQPEKRLDAWPWKHAVLLSFRLIATHQCCRGKAYTTCISSTMMLPANEQVVRHIMLVASCLTMNGNENKS